MKQIEINSWPTYYYIKQKEISQIFFIILASDDFSAYIKEYNGFCCCVFSFCPSFPFVLHLLFLEPFLTVNWHQAHRLQSGFLLELMMTILYGCCSCSSPYCYYYFFLLFYNNHLLLKVVQCFLHYYYHTTIGIIIIIWSFRSIIVVGWGIMGIHNYYWPHQWLPYFHNEQ